MTAIAVATVVVVARISMCVCVAILRDNYGVDIYDAPGQVKQFLQPNHAKSQTQKQHRDGHGSTDGFYHNESSCRA